MINYKVELEYFENKYSEIKQNSYCETLKNILYTLIKFDTIEDLLKYYNTLQDETGIVFPRVEEDLKMGSSLEDIKSRIVICVVDKLLSKKVELETIESDKYIS